MCNMSSSLTLNIDLKSIKFYSDLTVLKVKRAHILHPFALGTTCGLHMLWLNTEQGV